MRAFVRAVRSAVFRNRRKDLPGAHDAMLKIRRTVCRAQCGASQAARAVVSVTGCEPRWVDDVSVNEGRCAGLAGRGLLPRANACRNACGGG